MRKALIRLKHYIPHLILLSGLYSIQAAFGVYFAVLCKELVDSSSRQELLHRAMVLLLITILWVAINFIGNMLCEYLSARIRIKLQQDLLHTVLTRDYSTISAIHSGEIMNYMFSDVQVITDGLTNIIPKGLYLGVRLVGASAVMLTMAPRFTVVMLACGGLLLLLLSIFRKKFKYLHKQMQEAQGHVRSFLQEAVESLMVVRVFRKEEVIETQAQKRQDEYYRKRMKKRTINMLAGSGLSFLFQTAYVATIIWGGLNIINGVLTYGSLVAMMELVGQLQSPITGFSGLISQYYSMSASAERLEEIEKIKDDEGAERKSKEADKADGEKAEENKAEVTFHHVSFAYDELPVLTDVNFTIHKGEFVSITGISGIGKSTLFLLLLGLIKPTEGETEGLEALRGNAAYVPQEMSLFAGTIRENVTMFEETQSGDGKDGKKDSSAEIVEQQDSKIWQALRIACADEFVRELPEGLDKKLLENGHGLSEGQMQRISIARAIYQDKPVLFLDEATSALDEGTEAEILRNIQKLEGKTCLIVTHRPAALEICNRHFVVEGGRLRETAK